MTESMLDGTFCSQCGEYLGDALGWPTLCPECGGEEWPGTQTEDWERERKEWQAECAERRLHANYHFDAASKMASEKGLKLMRRSESHYQLIGPSTNKHANGWLLNIYPGNLRLYSDTKRRGPFLYVKHDWNLLDVVKAAVRAEKRKEHIHGNHRRTEAGEAQVSGQ